MKMIYGVKDKPKLPALLVFSLQQLLSIMTATLVVPVIVGNGMSPAAALFGAGVGTFVYLLFTKFKSPVFLGSSFAFLPSMSAAFAGAVTVAAGYAGIIIGAIMAGLVYVVIAAAVKFAGVNWINKLMPPVVIGPTVALIGLSLTGNAVGDLQSGFKANDVSVCSPYIAIVVGLFTLTVVMLCSVYGKKMPKLIPFIIGILSGYAFASVLTVIGNATDCDAIKVINFDGFKAVFDPITLESFFAVPDFTFMTAKDGLSGIDGAYLSTVAAAYVPVAFVVFAEHIADHKNLSSIIETDLLEEPGLHRTLLGDGVGSMAGAFFGGCPNTTYGESVGCVAITKNASVYSIIGAAAMALLISFFTPFVAFVNSIPPCVMGGVCMALYGFIAVSGLKMIKNVNLDENKNLFVVSIILVSGIGGLELTFGEIKITKIAVSLILGILANLMLSRGKKEEE
ncbi:MAG: uracil-xanthine permease [Ruminococcaceae bacterium]|nr:uracil-xanthine permease [Oscillospiraceae bacterium]